MTQNDTNSFSAWAKNLATSYITSKKEASFSISTEAAGNNRQDLSLPVLTQLLNDGYSMVEWDSGASTHSVCIEINHQQWNLQSFITGLLHAAPIFERTHPGDISCGVIISGENLPTVRVDSFGNILEI